VNHRVHDAVPTKQQVIPPTPSPRTGTSDSGGRLAGNLDA
jgi:hypothetical protein